MWKGLPYTTNAPSVYYKRGFRTLQMHLPYTTNGACVGYGRWGQSDEMSIKEVFGGVLDAEVVAVGIVDAHEAPGHGVVAGEGEGYMAHRAAEVEFHAGVEKPIS